MNTATQKHKPFGRIFKRSSLDNFPKYKMSMVLYNGKNSYLNFEVVMTYTADGESVLKRTAKAYVVYSTQTGIR